MPKQWIIKLHEAALDADAELVAQLIEKIPASHALELMALRDWVMTNDGHNQLRLFATTYLDL